MLRPVTQLLALAGVRAVRDTVLRSASLPGQLSAVEWAFLWQGFERNHLTRAALAHLLLPEVFAQVFSAAGVCRVATRPADPFDSIALVATEVSSMCIH
jgi:hypothetical protein